MLTRESAWVPLHLPCVRSRASVDRAEATLTEIGVTLWRWRRRGRPPRWIVVGGHLNVQQPKDVQGVTGSWVWEEKLKGLLYERQAEAVMAFCREFKIEAVNTWKGAGSLGEPEAGGEAEGEEDAEMKMTAWRNQLDSECWPNIGCERTNTTYNAMAALTLVPRPGQP